jgi:hypothetical protein
MFVTRNIFKEKKKNQAFVWVSNVLWDPTGYTFVPAVVIASTVYEIKRGLIV